MSNSLNKVQLIGNLTADAEIKETPSGVKVATFSIATNKKWKDQGGNTQEDVEYHFIVAWRGLAEIIESYTEKGKKLYVEGELKTRSWDDASGIKRYKTEIVANNVILLSNTGSGTSHRDDESTATKKKDETQKKSTRKTPVDNESISIDDIPF